MSLLEMLAVFVLVALLSVLVVQGVGFFLGGYQTLVRTSRTDAQESLQRGWFAASMRGMVASQLPDRLFRGTPEALEGVTLQPLVAESGVPVKVRWTIRQREGDGFALAYQEGENTETTIAWTLPGERASRRSESPTPTAAALAFQYADSTGAWQNAWPLPRAPRERLPSAVRLASETGATLWLVVLDIHYEPIYEDDELAWRAPPGLVGALASATLPTLSPLSPPRVAASTARAPAAQPAGAPA